MEKIKVVITSIPLSVNFDDIKDMVKKDNILIEVVNNFVSELPEDVEIFKHYHNIIVTSKKYYCAFFESDLKLVNKK